MPPMPKRLMILIIAASLAITACGGSGSTSSPPTTVPGGSPTPNPKITKTTVQVNNFGTPVPKIPVEESTPRSMTSPRPGKPFDTEITNKKGNAHFKNLKPSQTYCYVAILGRGREASTCATWELWQSGLVLLGA